MLFACDIKHAERLAKLANKQGIGAAALHSKNSGGDNEHYLKGFVEGTYPLLINVHKMTHGVDIPEIETVFLCRPTASDTLFSQMAGRGARILGGEQGKATFNLVEFTDNLSRFKNALMTAKIYFEGAAQSEATRAAAATVHERHAFDPTGQLRTITGRFGLEHPGLAGLTYREKQTFGVEIELTTKDGVPSPSTVTWRAGAKTVHEAVRRVVPRHTAAKPYAGYGLGDHTRWTTESDSSAGWEVVSRVLDGEAGVAELADVVNAISLAAEDANLRVNFRTGLHLHLGWEIPDETDADTAKRLVNLLQWVHALEPWLGSLVAPSRVAEYAQNSYDVTAPNFYCQPVSSAYPVAKYARNQPKLTQLKRATEDSDDTKYTSVNLLSFWQHGAVEVRLHGGTTDANKIAWWFGLWTAILWAAEQGPPQGVTYTKRDVITPDFTELGGLSERLPQQGREALLAWAAGRQRDIRKLWERHPQLRSHVSGASR